MTDFANIPINHSPAMTRALEASFRVAMSYRANILASASDYPLAVASAPFDQALPGFAYVKTEKKLPRRMRRRS